MPEPSTHHTATDPIPPDDSLPAHVVYSETAEVHVREDGSRRIVPITDASKPAIPESLKQSWRDSLDALADSLAITAAVVVQITRNGLLVLASSTNRENPYAEGSLSPFGEGRYCEAVIGIDSVLSIPEASASPVWRDSPDCMLGIESYYGAPLHWSDGSFFGSLCILDRKTGISNAEAERRTGKLSASIERDLEELVQSAPHDELNSSAEAMDAMFRYAPGGIFSYSAEQDERFSFISINMLSFLGYTDHEFREKFENRFSKMVWYEDRERVLAEIDEQISHGSFDTCEYRIEKKNGDIVWVHDEGHIVTDENGKRWFFVVIVDITGTMDAQLKLTQRNRELENAIRERQSTLDDIPGGVRVFAKQEGRIICLNANQYFADMIGIDKSELIDESFSRSAERIHPDDRKRHRANTVEDLDLHRTSEGTYRFLNARTGEYRWYHVDAALRTQQDGTELAYFHYTDVDDLKRAEYEAQMDQKRFELAVKGAHLTVWEYDIAAKQMIVPEGESGDYTRAHYGFSGSIVENVPESTLRLLLTDDDRARLLALYDKIASGSEYATTDVWFKRDAGDDPCCERFTYYVEKDESGTPIRAYGVGTDITAQMQEQERFHQSIQSILNANPAALCTFQLNLTKDICYEGHGVSPFILKTLHSNTASGLFDKCLGIIPYEKDRDLFRSVFNRETLMGGFAEGKANRHIDYRRSGENGTVDWVRTFVSLLKNPESGDIEGAIYSIDISHEKRRDDVFEMLTGEEYELIALLDLDTGKVEAFHVSASLPQSYDSIFRAVGDVCDFDEMRRNGANTWVAEEDRRKYLDGTDSALLKNMLDRDGHYELTVKGEVAQRGTVYRKLQHYYLDDEGREVLIADSDVTQSYLEQQRELEEKRRGQLERTLIDTVNSLPASSALFLIRDDVIVLDRCSDEFRRMVGYDQGDELLWDSAHGGLHPDDAERVIQLVRSHVDEDEPFSSVYRIITKSGGYMWVSANFIRFNFGDQKYLYAAYTDIDEVKRQEQQLAEQYDAAQKYLDSVASTYLLTGRVNLTRNTIEESSNANTLSADSGQISYDECIARLVDHLVSASDLTNCERTFDRKGLIEAYGRGERTRSVVFRVRSAEDEILWVRNSINLTKRPSTGDIVMFSAASDITQEELTKAIMDEVLPRQYDYISCIDTRKDEIVLFLSGHNFLNGLDIRSGAGFEESERDYCNRYIMPQDRERYLQFTSLPNIVSALQQGGRYIDSFSVDEGAGQRVTQVEFFYIDPESGLVATSRTDITDAQKRQLEQEETLRRALASAESANAAKSEFLSRMSHDMRTPLNGIIGLTYLTAEMDMPDQIRENLMKIDTSSKFLLGLINDILDMTKAESRKIELNPEPYPPAEFYGYIDAVIKPLCNDRRQTLVIRANPPEDIVPLFDKLRINQVLFNLLSNAVKFTPEGGTITYDAHFGKADARGRIPLHITVSDTGIGMSDEFQQVLFDPFTQEERLDASETRGTGLGLSIVRKLIALMGGTISVESTVGSGTTFIIDMTVDSVPADAPGARAEKDVQQNEGGSLEGKRILLCEDHPLNQEIAVALLAEQGAIVDVADNGAYGVDMFAKSAAGFYDAVLMDIRMPIMNGYEATRNIRSLDRTDAKTVPIIAMTADAFTDDVQRCIDAGMDDHIPKPIDPQEMFGTLERILSRSRE